MSQSASGTSKELAKFKSTFIQKMNKEQGGSSAEVTERMIQNEGRRILDLHYALGNAKDQNNVEAQKSLRAELGAFQSTCT